MRLWKLFGVLAYATLAAIASVAIATAQTASDYDYVTTIVIENSTGATLTDVAVRASINASNLVTGGFIAADGQDLLVLAAGSTESPPTAQDMTSNDASWWIPISSLASAETGSFTLYSGQNTPAGDNPQFMFLSGSSESIDVPDDSTLDITTNLTLLVDNLELPSIPTTTAFILNKSGAYELGVVSGTSIFAAVHGGTGTVDLRPNGAGFATALTPSGCGSNNWQCVDDSSPPDDASTVVLVTSTTSLDDYYDLGALPASITSDVVINTIDVTWRAQLPGGGAGEACGGLRLNGVDSFASPCNVAATTSWAYYTDEVTRPGGGSWTTADIADLQVILRLASAARTIFATQVFVTLNVVPRHTATWASAVVDTEYDVLATYDGSTLALLIDGATQATDVDSFTIGTTNATAVVGDAGFIGFIDRIRVGDTSIASPTYKLDLQFEPTHVAETQAGTAGNSWTWLGTVSDQSASSNDATYTFVRDMASVSVDVGPTTARSGSVFSPSVDETGPTVVSGSVSDPFGDSFDETTSLQWPLTIISVGGADFPPALIGMVAALFFGLVFGAILFFITGGMPAGALIGGVLGGSIGIIQSPVANATIFLMVMLAVALLILLPAPFRGSSNQ